eukprot:3743145-Pleurochrysis_carterae.AAC.4
MVGRRSCVARKNMNNIRLVAACAREQTKDVAKSHGQCYVRSLTLLRFFEHAQWLYNAYRGQFRSYGRCSVIHSTVHGSVYFLHGPWYWRATSRPRTKSYARV